MGHPANFELNEHAYPKLVRRHEFTSDCIHKQLLMAMGLVCVPYRKHGFYLKQQP